MITISNMSVLENSIAFAGQHTAFSMQCVNRSAACGLLFCARKDGRYAGYLCAAAESGCIRILYAYTIPALRKQGVFTELMRFVAENSRVPVRVNITESHEFHDVVRAVCLKFGYEQSESVRIFTCHKDMYPVWERFMSEKGDRLAAYLGRRGYQVMSFAEEPEDIIDQLRNSPRSEYKNMLDPAVFLDIPANCLSWDMSYAAVKDGRLAGYVLVTQNSPTKAVFEHISESNAEQGTGLILLPYAAAMKKAFELSGIETISYAMYESNARANAFREETLNMLKPSVTVSENYYLKKQSFDPVC